MVIFLDLVTHRFLGDDAIITLCILKYPTKYYEHCTWVLP